MSTWYRTGTATVTNGSTAVTGSGTAWTANARVGDAFHGPDGRVYEITALSSATALTLATAYLGGSAGGQTYAIQPTRGLIKTFLDTVMAWLSNTQSYVDGPLSGKFSDGSSALPGVTFGNDPGSGMLLAANSQLGLATGGATRALLTPSALQVNVPMTGTAVQSSTTDTTSNRLMKNGAHGLGGRTIEFTSGSIDDSTIPTGFYRVTASATGTKPEPQGDMIVMRRTDANPAGAVTQLFSFGSLWRRTWSGSAWTAWEMVFSRTNILGTVSQAAGVPTGAVIERGANANGTYIKWADGTLICTREVTPLDISTALGSNFRSATATHTMPHSFSQMPAGFGSCNSSNLVWVSNQIASLTTWSPTAFSASSRTGDTIVIGAVGRWF